MRALALLLVLPITACATTAAPRSKAPDASRGMRADAHLEAARSHDARAASLARWPEMQRDPTGFEDPASGLWYRSFDSARNESRLAAQHRTEVARIHAEFDEACAELAGTDVTISPLQRFGLGGIPTEHGVVIVLSRDAGPPNRLMAALRCHRAWMMLGEAGMENCPLDMRGLKLQTYGDETGISVEITTSDRSLVPELQRRAAQDLEMAAKLRDTQVAR
jgi:hypothetical protein